MSGKLTWAAFVVLSSISPAIAGEYLATSAGKDFHLAPSQAQQAVHREIEQQLDEEIRQRAAQIKAAQTQAKELSTIDALYNVPIKEKQARVSVGNYDLFDGFSISCSTQAGRPICRPASP